MINEIVRLIYDNGAHKWPVRDKGVLVAAVKLQLEEKPQEAQNVIQQ